MRLRGLFESQFFTLGVGFAVSLEPLETHLHDCFSDTLHGSGFHLCCICPSQKQSVPGVKLLDSVLSLRHTDTSISSICKPAPDLLESRLNPVKLWRAIVLLPQKHLHTSQFDNLFNQRVFCAPFYHNHNISLGQDLSHTLFPHDIVHALTLT